MANNKPFTKEGFGDLVRLSNDITTHVKQEHIGPVWDSYQAIIGEKISRPCTCASAAGEWKRAVDTIRDYIKNNSESYND